MIVMPGTRKWILEWQWEVSNGTSRPIKIQKTFLLRCLKVFGIETARTAIVINEGERRRATVDYKNQDSSKPAQNHQEFIDHLHTIFLRLSTNPNDVTWPELAYLGDEYKIASVALFHELIHLGQSSKRPWCPVLHGDMQQEDERQADRMDRQYAHLIHTGGLPPLLLHP